MRRLYFVRHGQTDWNKEHKLMGLADIPLNEEGARQAEAVRDALRERHFSAILSSPLRRAQQTAEIITEAHPGLKVVTVDCLRERDFGEFEGRENDGAYFGLWRYGADTIERGETTTALNERISACMQQIDQRYDGDVLVVAHGGVGLMIAAYFKGIPEDGDLLRYVARNGEVQEFVAERDSN